MTLRDLIPHLDKPAVSGDLDTEIAGFAYDSRKSGPGIAFVALRGTHADGHASFRRPSSSVLPRSSPNKPRPTMSPCLGCMCVTRASRSRRRRLP